MSPAIYNLSGTCHCGAIRMHLAFTRPPAETEVRACQCGLCKRQGAATISDPSGHAVIEMEEQHAGRYQFATATAISLICRRCGVYAGAILEAEGCIWSIANTRGLALAEFEGRAATPMVYEHETGDQRIARGMQRWTPTDIRRKSR
jgi:hypothetical protein